MRDKGFATYNFMVQVCTDDYNLVNNFGYELEDAFVEDVRRRIMKGLVDMPFISLINIDQIVTSIPDEDGVASMDEVEEDV